MLTYMPAYENPVLRRILARLTEDDISAMSRARHEFNELRGMYMTALKQTAPSPGEEGVHPVYCFIAGRLSLPLSLMFGETTPASQYMNRPIVLQALKPGDIDELLAKTTYLPALVDASDARMELAQLLHDACAGVPRSIHWALAIMATLKMDVSTSGAMQVAVSRAARILARSEHEQLKMLRTMASPQDADLFYKLTLCDLFDIPLRGTAPVPGAMVSSEWRDQQRELLAVSTYLPVMFDPAPGGMQIPRVAAMLRDQTFKEDPPNMPAMMLYAGLPREKDVCMAVIRGGLHASIAATVAPDVTLPLFGLVPFLDMPVGSRLVRAGALQLRPVEVSSNKAPFTLAKQAGIPADMKTVHERYFTGQPMAVFKAALGAGRLPWDQDPANKGKVLVVMPAPLAPSADVFVSVPREAWADAAAGHPPLVVEAQIKGAATADEGKKIIMDTVCEELVKSVLFHPDTDTDTEVRFVLLADTLDKNLAPGIYSVSARGLDMKTAPAPVRAYVERELAKNAAASNNAALAEYAVLAAAVLAAALARLKVVVVATSEFRKWAPRRDDSNYAGIGSDVKNPVPELQIPQGPASAPRQPAKAKAKAAAVRRPQARGSSGLQA